MVQIVLIRPGATDYDEQGRIQGTLDIPLNEHGSQSVERLIGDLKDKGITMVYGCPCQSAWQTATGIAAGLGAKLKKVDKLQNLDHGLWQGMCIDEVKRKQPTVYRQWQDQPEIICPPEGEMLSQAQQRVETALAKLLKKHKQGTVAIVVPEPLASLAHSYLAQTELGDLWNGCKTCGSWELITVEPASLMHT